ncbi:MAG TPA: MBL fold metallo-hydrolase [Steroidobacteraceae bacterium]|jgi:glyoxylase-like metal-dependent hydrolase (beta-lactamase superfamily II)|nr:MBL fold metallo-hydrolase [Steroidobacteraceae bacterium]
MTRSADRRSFLKTVIAGATAAALAPLHPALAAASSPSAPQKLSDNLWLFVSGGDNVVACRDTAGVALVDGGPEAASRELLRQVSQATGAGKVHTLFNTHWHPDQTGSNVRLGGEAKIIAHENTRLWLGYANPVPPQNALYGPLPAKARPSDTFFYDSVQTQFGEEPVQYGYLGQAHTDGDIYVYFRKSNVLVTGGPVSAAGWPVIDYKTGGWIQGMIDGIRTLANLATDQTRIVPANGPVLSKADLGEQQQMYTTIAGRMQKMMRQGLGVDEVVARNPAAEYEAKWGDSKQFTDMAFRSLWGHMAPDS